jgi:hypothetical protein
MSAQTRFNQVKVTEFKNISIMVLVVIMAVSFLCFTSCKKVDGGPVYQKTELAGTNWKTPNGVNFDYISFNTSVTSVNFYTADASGKALTPFLNHICRLETQTNNIDQFYIYYTGSLSIGSTTANINVIAFEGKSYTRTN